MHVIFFVLLFSFLGSASSFAEPEKSKKPSSENTSPKKIGTFGDWRAFTMTEKGKPVCYMVSFPKSEEGTYKKRGKPYIMITHRPEENYNVVSVYFGYKLAKGTAPHMILSTGNQKKDYTLFAEGETAWANSDEDDDRMTQGIVRLSDRLIVHGESLKGTKTKDTYSLKGSFKAYTLICEKCGYKQKKS